jgi:hypothetical protein
MGRFEGGAALQEPSDPGPGRLRVSQPAVRLPHAPGDAALPLETQVAVGITAQQEKDGRSLGRKGDKVDPARREGDVHGQHARMAQKKAVQDGLPPVRMPADTAADMAVMGGQFRESADLS